MRATGRDPGGGEIPMMRRSQPQFRPSPLLCKTHTLCTVRLGSSVELSALIIKKDLMSEAMGIALLIQQGDPYICAIKKKRVCVISG